MKITLSSHTTDGQKQWALLIGGQAFSAQTTDERQARSRLLDVRLKHPTYPVTYWDGDARKEYALLVPTTDPTTIVSRVEETLRQTARKALTITSAI